MTKRYYRDYVLVAFSTIFTVVCIGLGFWQVGRLSQRRAFNAKVFARLNEPAVPVQRLPRDTATLHYRHVLVQGSYDYAHEVTLADRQRLGSPGVNIITPVHIAGTDTVVLVNRGWIYSPDALTADPSRWREGDSVNSAGYAIPLGRPLPGTSTLRGHPNVLRWLDTAALHARIPFPVFPFSVVLEGDMNPHAAVPPRVPPPPLDEGPHTSYAIQWFSFAAIGVFGAFYFLRVAPKRRRNEWDELE